VKKNLLWLLISVLLTGCASVKEGQVARLSMGIPQNPGKATDSTAFRASYLAVEAMGRQVPGTLPNGVGIGIAAAKLLTAGSFQDLAKNFPHLEVWMPEREARDEKEATLKMSAIVEKALRDAFPPGFKTKIFEYENVATIRVRDRNRFIRVDGPGCENWSCIAGGPIPDKNTTLSGEMIKTECVEDLASQTSHPCYAYTRIQGIGFTKIVKEWEEDGLLGGHWHKFEEKVVPGFDYAQFYLRFSKALPAWAFYYIPPNFDKDNELLKDAAFFNQGQIIKI
jgi:hypothetical protein